MSTRAKNILFVLASYFVFIGLIVYFFALNPKILFGGNDQKNKITVCHATESDLNSFVKIVVSDDAYKAHFENPGTPKSGHEKDFIFEGDVDCPSLNQNPSPSISPTINPSPTPEVTISTHPELSLCKSQNAECDINSTEKQCCDGLVCIQFNSISGNAKCLQDSTVSPTPSNSPTETVAPAPSGQPTITPSETINEKWTICHATSSDVHPFNKITVSSRSEHGHFDENGSTENGHEKDLIFQGDVNCPSPTITPTPPICDSEYSCIECSLLLKADTCYSYKETYCMHNYDCGYKIHNSLQCINWNHWMCNCETPSPTPTDIPTSTPSVTPPPTNLGLVVDKSNTVSGEIGKGAEFMYDILVINTGLTSFYEVNVKDVLPGGFSYIGGSSYIDGALISDPSNDNGLLTFNIGSLASNTTKKLSYKVKAIDEAVGGNYYNLAFAIGKYLEINSNISSVYESGSDNSRVTIGSGKDYSEKVGGEVLGTSVSLILPETGSDIALILMILTMFLVLITLYQKGYLKKDYLSFLNIFRNSLRLFAPVMLYLYFTATPILAVSDTVLMQDLPEYVTTDGFKLSYSALSNSAVNAKFFVRKDGDSSWRQFGGTVSGYSGWVQVGGSEIYSGDGRYYFKVEINGGTAIDETNSLIDRGSPNPVSDYRKEKVAGGFYRLYWRTPDNDDFSRVFIYRSSDRNFTADGTTKVGEIGGSKNSNVTWENLGLDSSKDYYYAVRAVDKAGNASGLVADPETSTVVGLAASTTSQEEVVLYPTEKIEDRGEQEKSDENVLGDANKTDKEESDKNIVKKIVQFAKERTKITAGITIGIAIVLYFAYKKIKEFRIKKIGTSNK